MSKYRVTLTDSEGIILDLWELDTPMNNCEFPYLEDDGTMSPTAGCDLGKDISRRITIDALATRPRKQS